MKNKKPIPLSLTGKKVTVLGFGISNRPLVRYLCEKGADITVRDLKDVALLGDECIELLSNGVKFVTGDGYLSDIDADIIFRSPGIRPDAGDIRSAVEKGALLTSEMELFLDQTPAFIIAITGSDGKTTSTTLTYKLLEEEYKNTNHRVYVGGNIGKPLLPECEGMTCDDIAVVELSSFQLQGLKSSINRAAITNITPNHLNWHTDMDEYANAKMNVFASEDCEQLAVNANDLRTRAAGISFKGDTIFFSYDVLPDVCLEKTGAMCLTVKGGSIIMLYGGAESEVLKISDIKLPGRHNVENYMTAIANTMGFVSKETIKKVAREFGGVEHRLEFVREFEGVKYYNSSIDSSPTRTEAALSALSEKPVVICGGYDKNIPFAPLASTLSRYARAVVLTGATRDKIKAAIDGYADFDRSIKVEIEPDFTKAIYKAREIANGEGTVLLSPACASFDAFPNFEVRGKAFKDTVNNFS